MGKKTTKQRVYTNDFKTEAVALAKKKEKPVRSIEATPEITEHILRRWMQASQETAGSAQHSFPVHRIPRLPA